MLRSYSKYKTSIAISRACATPNDTEIVVFWNGDDFEIRNHVDGFNGISEKNLVGLYNKWFSNLDILSDCDVFIKQFNQNHWPDNDLRIDVIASNGPTGEHYLYVTKEK